MKNIGFPVKPVTSRARNFRAMLKRLWEHLISQKLMMTSCTKIPLFFSQQPEHFYAELIVLTVCTSTVNHL